MQYKIKNGAVYYDGDMVLENIDIEINDGEKIAIVGPSGSGKSTLLNILAGNLMPDGGRVLLFGKDVHAMGDSELSRLRRTDIGFVYQSLNLIPTLTLRENILLPLYLSRERVVEYEEKMLSLCHRFGIDLISLDCDGVTGALQSTWMENGVNILFPIEVGVWGDQFAAARERFGTRQRGVGGMDKTALRKDKAAVDAEIERMQKLASLGGFIPCPDHRLMPGTKFELVQYYAEQIKKIKI